MRVVPGMALGSELKAGQGTYEENGVVYASLGGEKVVTQEGNVQVVSVEHQKLSASDKVLRIHDTVTCRVVQISLRHVGVEIIAVRNVPLAESVAGVIPAQDVRSFDVENVELDRIFSLGNTVKAVVRSYGDSRAYYLTTAKPGLGVIPPFI